jgi:hypothetical protein
LESVTSLPDVGWSVLVSPEVAWLARRSGRDDAFRAVFARQPKYTRWLDAADAISEGDLIGAADVLGEIGARPIEAFCRLQSGFEPQVRQALEFYRSVGATRYIREGEALLAASA